MTRDNGYSAGQGRAILYAVNGEFNDWCYGDTLAQAARLHLDARDRRTTTTTSGRRPRASCRWRRRSCAIELRGRRDRRAVRAGDGRGDRRGRARTRAMARTSRCARATSARRPRRPGLTGTLYPARRGRRDAGRHRRLPASASRHERRRHRRARVSGGGGRHGDAGAPAALPRRLHRRRRALLARHGRAAARRADACSRSTTPRRGSTKWTLGLAGASSRATPRTRAATSPTALPATTPTATTDHDALTAPLNLLGRRARLRLLRGALGVRDRLRRRASRPARTARTGRRSPATGTSPGSGVASRRPAPGRRSTPGARRWGSTERADLSALHRAAGQRPPAVPFALGRGARG